MLNEGLDRAKGHSEVEELECVQENESLLLSSLDEEGDERASASVLLLEDTSLISVVPLMAAGASWIADILNRG